MRTAWPCQIIYVSLHPLTPIDMKTIFDFNPTQKELESIGIFNEEDKADHLAACQRDADNAYKRISWLMQTRGRKFRAIWYASRIKDPEMKFNEFRMIHHPW